ncbi:hypothetical protein SGLAM104S_08752 [Streptomyces glaucescens]
MRQLGSWEETELAGALVSGRADLVVQMAAAAGPEWAEGVHRLEHGLLVAKHALPALRSAARQGGRAAFVAVTRLDGAGGLRGGGDASPLLGGIGGLVKTLAVEAPELFTRTVDFAPDLARTSHWGRNQRQDSRTEGGERIFGHDPLAPGPGAREDRDRHRIYCTRGGFLGTEAETAVPDGLLLPAGYLAGLDRSFHWALRTAHDALADAGVSPAAASGGAEGRRTGVVFGNYPFPTPASGRTAGKLWDAAVTEGLAAAGFPEAGLPFLTENGSPAMTADGSPAGERGAAGGRGAAAGPAAAPAAHLAEAHNLWPGGLPAHVVAAALGLGGPRFTLDAACSSALYALELACAQLATGRADLMLAGGVCAPDPTVIHLSFSDLRAYPPDGAPSQPFDARSRGIITGQGAAMVAVKRLADARRDGDRVLAVIEGIGLGNDGPGKHLLVPNVNGQLASYDLAYRRAGVDPESVRYVECHATGTPIGDRTELEGVERYFGRGPLLGSVKGNIGHLLTAAGMSSLVKVVLALGHGVLPPTAGLRQPLPGTVADRVVRAPCRGRPGTVYAGPPSRRSASAAPTPTSSSPARRPPRRRSRRSRARPRPRWPSSAWAPTSAPSPPSTPSNAPDTTARTSYGSCPRTAGAASEAGPLPGGARDAAYVAEFEADATAYRIPPNDLDHFNQQHLLMMRVAEEALRDAGYERGAPGGTGRRVAVVLGMEMEPSAHGHAARHALGRKLAAWCARAGLDPSDEQLAALTRAARDGIHDSIEANEVLSYIGNIMAARISSLWNLTGPSFTVSSDSSVGADALDAARLLLLDPSVEAVLVGAVDLAAGPESTLARDLLEPGGAPLLGEGAGAVVVTRPGSVPPDRTVYATVDALAVRHSATLSPRPDPGLVAAAAEEALAAAGVTAADVELVETGTTDPAALAGLTRVWSATRAGGALRTALSAAGAAVGDTGCASVLASLIRAALCLHHAYQPVAPDGVDRDALDGSGFFLAADSRPWPRRRRDGRRLACVSVTGTAGSHAHLVLGGAQTRGEVAATDWTRSGGSLVVPVGADDLDGLLRRLTELRDTVADGGDWDRLTQDRPAALKAVLVADDPAGLVRQAEQALKDLPGVHRAGGEWTSPSGSCFAARPARRARCEDGPRLPRRVQLVSRPGPRPVPGLPGTAAPIRGAGRGARRDAAHGGPLPALPRPARPARPDAPRDRTARRHPADAGRRHQLRAARHRPGAGRARRAGARGVRLQPRREQHAVRDRRLEQGGPRHREDRRLSALRRPAARAEEDGARPVGTRRRRTRRAGVGHARAARPRRRGPGRPGRLRPGLHHPRQHAPRGRRRR